MFKFFKKLALFFFLSTIACSIIGISLLSFFIWVYNPKIPDHRSIIEQTLPSTSYLFASDCSMIDSFSKEGRLYIEINEIPDLVKNAFISAEDKSFYSNPGIDVTGIARALYATLTSNSIQGGSTITQQVVKNMLLTNERTIERKIKEAILSLRTTKFLSKDKILELYLNKIYLGNGAYGVMFASLKYFDKSVKKLSISEAALLAALTQAPGKLNPFMKSERLIIRRNWVISRMLEDGYITEEEALKAKSSPIAVKKQSTKKQTKHSQFFVDEVRKYLLENFNDKIYSHGIFIHSTLIPEYQQSAALALKKGIEEYDKRQGWRGAITNISNTNETLDSIDKKIREKNDIRGNKVALITSVKKDCLDILLVGGQTSKVFLKDIDWKFRERKKLIKITDCSDFFKKGDIVIVSKKNKDSFNLFQIPEVNGGIVVLNIQDSSVLAMYGGYDYKNNKFNRVTKAERQTGSLFKTFVYLSALENKIQPNSIFSDEQQEVSVSKKQPNWIPKNYMNNYAGPITMRKGFELSKNMVTIRLLQVLGLEKINDTAIRFEVLKEKTKNKSSVLGAEETTLLNIANAYAAIANGGRLSKPKFINGIQDRGGKFIYKSDKRNCNGCFYENNSKNTFYENAIPPEQKKRVDQKIVSDQISCYQMASLLNGSVERGTSWRAKIAGANIYGKTGTTNNSKDTWFIGFTKDILVGIYVGFDSPKIMGSTETGSRVAVPIFNEFINSIKDTLDMGPIKPAIGINKVKIDYDTGLPVNENTKKSVLESFRVGYEPD